MNPFQTLCNEAKWTVDQVKGYARHQMRLHEHPLVERDNTQLESQEVLRRPDGFDRGGQAGYENVERPFVPGKNFGQEMRNRMR